MRRTPDRAWIPEGAGIVTNRMADTVKTPELDAEEAMDVLRAILDEIAAIAALPTPVGARYLVRRSHTLTEVLQLLRHSREGHIAGSPAVTRDEAAEFPWLLLAEWTDSSPTVHGGFRTAEAAEACASGAWSGNPRCLRWSVVLMSDAPVPLHT